jgi:hypothetical protein
MNIRVLSVKDRYLEWQKEFAALPRECRDLHYSAEYFACFQEKYGHDAHLLIAENDQVKIIYPFISEEFRRIIPINEYGGPLFLRKTPLLPKDQFIRASHALMTAIEEFWASRRCKHETFNIHPFFNEVQHHVLNKFTELKYLKEVSFVVLDPAATFVVPAIRGKKIKIERQELTEKTLPLVIETFQDHFPVARGISAQKYFESYLQHLSFNSMFFTAAIDGSPVGGLFLLHGYHSAYLQLISVQTQANASEVTAALIYESINWAKGLNYSYYHLGDFKREKGASMAQKLKLPGQHSAFAYGYEKTRDL